ncbi:hypothetical protein HK097_000237 [Rhizophlyctis rosea]|uniref:Uncharacterized protein n=1 Tax=Rhizophlyctis rosea TaxID=64517 RepID=A0AAD5SDU3_9FUNG|nr:hypothetical protein HK097_000237 [Rhizophlyctis rosea]
MAVPQRPLDIEGSVAPLRSSKTRGSVLSLRLHGIQHGELIPIARNCQGDFPFSHNTVDNFQPWLSTCTIDGTRTNKQSKTHVYPRNEPVLTSQPHLRKRNAINTSARVGDGNPTNTEAATTFDFRLNGAGLPGLPSAGGIAFGASLMRLR